MFKNIKKDLWIKYWNKKPNLILKFFYIADNYEITFIKANINLKYFYKKHLDWKKTDIFMNLIEVRYIKN